MGRPVVQVDEIAVFRTNVHDLLAFDGEQRRDQRRALDRGNTGGVNKAEIANVLAG